MPTCLSFDIGRSLRQRWLCRGHRSQMKSYMSCAHTFMVCICLPLGMLDTTSHPGRPMHIPSRPCPSGANRECFWLFSARFRSFGLPPLRPPLPWLISFVPTHRQPFLWHGLRTLLSNFWVTPRDPSATPRADAHTVYSRLPAGIACNIHRKLRSFGAAFLGPRPRLFLLSALREEPISFFFCLDIGNSLGQRCFCRGHSPELPSHLSLAQTHLVLICLPFGMPHLPFRHGRPLHIPSRKELDMDLAPDK
jgi:hypothetical protein